MLRLETDQAAFSQDRTSRRSARLLWMGVGFAVVALLGVSARAVAPHASSVRPSGLVAGLAFTPVSVLRPGMGGSTALRSAARLPGPGYRPGALSGKAALPRAAAVPRNRGSTKMMAAVGEAPNVKVGDMVPDVSLDSGFPPEKVSLRDLTKGKKIVLVGLPGAFTPT